MPMSAFVDSQRRSACLTDCSHPVDAKPSARRTPVHRCRRSCRLSLQSCTHSSNTMNATVGCRTVEMHDVDSATRFPMNVLYPCSGIEQPERFGPYISNVCMNGPVASGSFPLVVISHGSGGSPHTHRMLGADLARNGFIVAMIEHFGNNRSNNELADTATNLEMRPRHGRAAINWVHADEALRDSLVRDCAAVIGHSIGGYTALVLAGGLPTSVPHDSPGGVRHSIPVTADARVKSIILLAPATPWFMAPGALRNVRVPILMFTGDSDAQTNAMHARWVSEGVRAATLVDHRVVQNAGHYSFLSPFPPEMTSPGFAPSQDPPGFDRERFHEQMYLEIRAFLDRTLCCGRNCYLDS